MNAKRNLSHGRVATAKRSSSFWGIIATPGSAWIIAFFVVPMLLLLTISFTITDFIGRSEWGNFYLGAYAELLSPRYLPTIGRTFLYSLIVTVVCLVLGYIIAYTISRHGGRIKILLILGVLVPWFIDYLIRIYAWLQIFGSKGILTQTIGLFGAEGTTVNLLGTDFAVITGLIYNILPLMVLPIFVSLEALDYRLIEACRDLNGTAFHAFLYVTLPASVPGIASGMTITFLITFGDFATARILGGPQQYMLGNLVQDQFSGLGAMSFGAAITMCVLIVILVVLGIFTRVSRAAERRLS